MEAIRTFVMNTDQADPPGRLTPSQETIDRVYRFLLAFTGDPDAAADLTQETFLKIVRAIPGVSKNPPSIAYIFTVARNAAISRFRRQRLEERHLTALPTSDDPTLGTTSPTPADMATTKELRSALRTALRSLSPDLRAVFLLSEVEGLKYREIAKILRCPTGTVASRKNAAVNALRNQLRRSGHAV